MAFPDNLPNDLAHMFTDDSKSYLTGENFSDGDIRTMKLLSPSAKVLHHLPRENGKNAMSSFTTKLTEDQSFHFERIKEKWGSTHYVQFRYGTDVDLRNLAKGESVCAGDGKTFHCLLTDKTPTVSKNDYKTKFYKKVKKEDGGCYLWEGSYNKDGLPQFSIKGKTYTAQKAAWILHHGNVPRAMYVFRLCQNKMCVNITHLYLGDYRYFGITNKKT